MQGDRPGLHSSFKHRPGKREETFLRMPVVHNDGSTARRYSRRQRKTMRHDRFALCASDVCALALMADVYDRKERINVALCRLRVLGRCRGARVSCASCASFPGSDSRDPPEWILGRSQTWLHNRVWPVVCFNPTEMYHTHIHVIRR